MHLRIAPARPDIRVLAALVVLLFLSAVLGIMNLDYDALWQDELLSVMDAGGAPYPSRSLADVWNGIASRNPYHAPGFFLMLNLWGRLMGWEPLALRALSFLAGLLAVAWMYRLGAAVLSKQAGLAAAGLLVASVFFQHYTHELRMYSLMVLLGTFNLWAYYSLLARGFRARRRLWLGYWLSIVGMLYLHYFAALPLIAVGIYHLFFPRRDAGWWRALAVMLAGALAFVPWLGALLDGLNRAQGDTAIRALGLTPTDALQRTLLALSNGSTLAVLVLLALLGMVGVLAWRHPDARLRVGLRRLGFVACLTLTLLLVGNALTEMLHEGRLRYVLVLWAPVIPLLAAAFTAGRGRLRPVMAVGLLLWLTFGVSLTILRIQPFNLDDRAYIFPLQLVAREYRQNAQLEDFLLAFVPPNQFTWRYRFLGDYYLLGIGGGYSIPNVYDEGGGEEDDPAALYAAIQERERLWVASMPAEEPS